MVQILSRSPRLQMSPVNESALPSVVSSLFILQEKLLLEIWADFGKFGNANIGKCYERNPRAFAKMIVLILFYGRVLQKLVPLYVSYKFVI